MPVTRTRKHPTVSSSARQRRPRAIQVDVNGPACPAPNIVSIAGMELHSSPILDTFFKFVVERHAIHQRRLAGQPPPWTTNDVMAKYPFTNVFRVFDRGSQYVLHNVINVGDQSLTEQCFRVMLFRAFNKEETWEYMEERLGGVTWRNFDLQAYEEILVDPIRWVSLECGSFVGYCTANYRITHRKILPSIPARSFYPGSATHGWGSWWPHAEVYWVS